MKKNKIFILIFACSLCSCQTTNNDSTSQIDSSNDVSIESSTSQIDSSINCNFDKHLIFTEMNTGYLTFNRAIEVTNVGKENINLEGYTINVYRNPRSKPTETIDLVGTVAPNESYVVVYSGADEFLKNKADLLSDVYLQDGTFPVSLSFNGEEYDSIGSIGYSYDFASHIDLVRKKEFFESSLSFEPYEWIKYPTDYFDNLGNSNVASEKELLDGPKLTEEDLNRPFCSSSINGDGGLIKVKLNRMLDGDTSYFDYGSSYSKYGVSGSLSTRYYGINCPEIAHSYGEVSDPYGDEAKEYTNNLLKQAKHIYIQSVKNYSIHETYGRMLGYVWISNLENPKISDYQLLNFLIIQNGFSNASFVSHSNKYNADMTWNGISFVEYLYDAQNFATFLELNIHSK